MMDLKGIGKENMWSRNSSVKSMVPFFYFFFTSAIGLFFSSEAHDLIVCSSSSVCNFLFSGFKVCVVHLVDSTHAVRFIWSPPRFPFFDPYRHFVRLIKYVFLVKIHVDRKSLTT